MDGPRKNIKAAVKKALPRHFLYFYRFLCQGDARAVLSFLVRPVGRTSLGQRFGLILRLYAISEAIPCPHTQTEMLAFIRRILALPSDLPGCVVEAGCYKGGSTAKFSLAARLAGRKLVVFDSFEGMPEHRESPVRNIFGELVAFPAGCYYGTLAEVKENVRRFGAPEMCEFRKGWFKDTLPAFRGPVAALFMDVDLAVSTRTLLRHLYPKLVPGGVLISHDGHLPTVIAVFRDESFWRREVGHPLPPLPGLGRWKLIQFAKPAPAGSPIRAKTRPKGGSRLGKQHAGASGPRKLGRVG